ncbi:MAG: chromosomal replication initiator protein DnaA [Proteobacteria bacterium]|nr:chromosomal replication initiator protein DnaA [Pseudomonadota bacterium]
MHTPDTNQSSPWDQLKQALKAQMPAREYGTWIAPLVIAKTDGRILHVNMPNALFYQRIHDDFLPLIERTKAELGLESFSLAFDLEGMPEIPDSAYNEELEYPLSAGELDQLAVASLTGPTAGFSRSLSKDHGPNTAYTFESFVRGPSNQFAMTTAQAVAAKPGQFYNPLFLCGGTGLGKTHLLHAVANEVLKHHPTINVTYTTSEQFMQELTYCLRFARTNPTKMHEFRRKYRMCDVLLIDDIQFLSGNKKVTQEEFFHTFNTLYHAKKQIIMTSDILPQGIPDIEERLRSRFQWGLIADIQLPDLEHRIEILHKKAHNLNVKLPQEVAEYIGKHTKRSVRDLEGNLQRLYAFSQFQGEPLTLNLAQKAFKDIFFMDAPKILTVDDIQKVVADHFKIKVADLKSKKKHTAVAHPRQIAMFLSRRLTTASLPELGLRFGGKDHTTVLHNVKKIETTMAVDLDLRAVVDSLQRQIEQVH